jgi:secreted PhoX family phosphatase
VVNPSANPTLADVLSAQVTRRMLLGGGLAAATRAMVRLSGGTRAPMTHATSVRR